MRRLSALFPLLMVLALAMAAYWLNYIVSLEGDGRGLNLRHEPDTVMENFTARQYGVDGNLRTHLVAERMFHFPDTDTSELIKPHVTLHNPEGNSVWTSTQGLVSEDNTRIDLAGKVRGVRAATAGNPEQVLVTERLTVLTEDQIGRSDAPVVYTEGKTRISAVGAEWDQARGLLNLHSQVNATLEQGRK